VLVRFAGPRPGGKATTTWCRSSCAAAARSLGGSPDLGRKPQQSGRPSTADGPFAGPARCRKDVTVPAGRCSPSPTRWLATKSWASAGGRHRRSSPANIAARESSACFHVQAPICAGRSAASQAHFVEMLRRESSTIQATPPTPGPWRSLGEPSKETVGRRCTRSMGFGAFGTAAPRQRQSRLPRRLSRPRRRRIIRRVFYGPADGPLAVNTLASRPTASRRSKPPAAGAPGRASYNQRRNRAISGGILPLRIALALFPASTPSWVAFPRRPGIAGLLRRRGRTGPYWLSPFVLATMLGRCRASARAESSGRICDEGGFRKTAPRLCRHRAMPDVAIRHRGSSGPGRAPDPVPRPAAPPLRAGRSRRRRSRPRRTGVLFPALIYWPVVPGAPEKPPQGRGLK